MRTYLQYIQDVRDIALALLPEEDRARLSRIKLVYGTGMGQPIRGVTMYKKWDNGCGDGKCTHGNSGEDTNTDLIEICALAQESFWQIAGTTIHEYGHALAGMGTGHGKEWKDACERLGLRRIKAAGTEYMPAMFSPEIRERIARLELPTEGRPVIGAAWLAKFGGAGAGACSHGRGTRGGKSFGAGSGRMRKYVCGCTPAVILRHAKDTLDATCNICREKFTLA